MSLKSGWIFSPRMDFCVFWLPLLLAYPVKSLNLMDSLVFFFAMRISIDMAHVLATAVPVSDRLKRKKLGHFIFLGSFVIVPVFATGMYHYSKILFMSVLGTNALVHVCRQQYGMVMVSRHNAREGTTGRWWDSVMMFNLTALPCLYWLSSLSEMKKTYFFENDLGYLVPVLPDGLVQGILVAHWVFNLLYVANVLITIAKKESVNWSKILLFLSTWAWFYGGLLVFESASFFFAAGLMIHGLTYLVFASRHSTGVPSLRDPFSLRKLIWIQAAAAIWAGTAFFMGFPLPAGHTHFFEPFVALPLIVHYCLDAFIWRKPMFS